jgi:MFS family permease
VKATSSLSSFYKELPRDLKTIMARSSIANFVLNLNPYNSIYIFALGASGTELGLLTSLSLGFTAISTILTGWISDRVDRKLMFLIGAFLGILVPLTYILVPSYIWLIPAFLFAGISDGIIQPSWTAMYANSVRNKQRGAIYGLTNVFILTPVLFAGLVGGKIVSMSGGLTLKGIRPVYILQGILLLIAWILVYTRLDKRVPNQPKKRLTFKTMLNDYGNVLSRKGVRSWIGMKSLGSLSIGLAGPFWMLYAAQVHGASAMIIAYMVTMRSLTQITLSPFTGRLTDSIGRKKMIIGGRVMMYLSASIFMILGKNHWILLFAWILMGVSDATGVAWQAQEAELVNVHQRARIKALSVAAFNLLAVPSSIIGGWLWDSVGKYAPFLIMVIIDGMIRMPIIYKYVPESKLLAPEPEDESAI